MSYILEALKKSEQERERGSIPDIKSVHTAESSATSSSKAHWWWILLVLVLMVNGAIFTVVYLGEETSPQQSQSSQAPAQQTAGIANSDIETSKAPSTPRSDQPDNDSSSTKSAMRSEKTEQQAPRVVFSKEPLQLDDTVGNIDKSDTSTESVAIEQPEQVQVEKERPMLVSELPESVRKQIPSIAFEGHVYSSSVERRSVMINGKKMREGDAVSADLMLREITPMGAEFDFQGYRFKLDALQDWSYR